MSVSTEAEIAYLREHKLGRLATTNAECQPHMTPVTYVYAREEDTIDVGGRTSERRRSDDVRRIRPESIRIRPTRIVSWGIEEAAPGASATARGIDHHARDVG